MEPDYVKAQLCVADGSQPSLFSQQFEIVLIEGYGTMKMESWLRSGRRFFVL